MRLPMAQVPRRRADQLRNLVRVLKFGAVNLDTGAGVAKQRFSHGFDDPGFSRSGGPEKQKISNRTARRIQSRQKHLVDFDHFLDGLVLTDDSAAKGAFELSGIIGAARWVQHGVDDGFHIGSGPGFPFLGPCTSGRAGPPSLSERRTNFVTPSSPALRLLQTTLHPRRTPNS